MTETMTPDEAAKVEELNLYKIGFTCTATIENPNFMSRDMRRLMGLYRPNHGKKRTSRQHVSRCCFYLEKRKKNYTTRQLTLKDLNVPGFFKRMLKDWLRG